MGDRYEAVVCRICESHDSKAPLLARALGGAVDEPCWAKDVDEGDGGEGSGGGVGEGYLALALGDHFLLCFSFLYFREWWWR